MQAHFKKVAIFTQFTSVFKREIKHIIKWWKNQESCRTAILGLKRTIMVQMNEGAEQKRLSLRTCLVQSIWWCNSWELFRFPILKSSVMIVCSWKIFNNSNETFTNTNNTCIYIKLKIYLRQQQLYEKVMIELLQKKLLPKKLSFHFQKIKLQLSIRHRT